MYFMETLVEPLQSTWSLKPSSLLNPQQDASRAGMWTSLVESEIARHTVTLLAVIRTKTDPRDGIAGSHKELGSSSSSSGADSVRGARRDRASVAANALRQLHQRREHAEEKSRKEGQRKDPFPFLMLCLVSNSMSILVTLLATVGASGGGPPAEQLLLHGKIFPTLDSVMHYLLRCTRQKGNARTGHSVPAPFTTGYFPWIDSVINVCMASCHVFHAMGCLPLEQQLTLVDSMPARFLDTLCCLAVDVLAEWVVCSTARVALVMVATLPRHTNVRRLLKALDERPRLPQKSTSKPSTDLRSAMLSPYFMRTACWAVQAVMPCALPPPPVQGKSKAPSITTAVRSRDRKHRTAALHDLFSLSRALLDIIELRTKHPWFPETDWVASCHVILVEDAASSIPHCAGGGEELDGFCRVDATGTWALKNGVVGMLALVTALCSLGCHCARTGYRLPSHVGATECCAELVTLLVTLQRAESGVMSPYMAEAVQLRGCMDACSHLVAALGTLIARRQQGAANHDTARGTSAMREERALRDQECEPDYSMGAAQSSRNMKQEDVFRRLVLHLLETRDMGLHPPFNKNSSTRGARVQVAVGELSVLIHIHTLFATA